jgi:ABC-type multidrug transport system fused ATPase/permease subunit
MQFIKELYRKLFNDLVARKRKMIPASKQKLETHKVTKPIQLLAAWLVGLVLVNGSFLATAVGVDSGSWISTALVVAAIVNVPLFLLAIFLLQTKFRPEMQEDSYYAQYLDKKTGRVVEVTRGSLERRHYTELRSEISEILKRMERLNTPAEDLPTIIEHSRYSIALNDHLPFFSDIRTELREQHFWVKSIFGRVNRSSAPGALIISINKGVEFSFISDILRLALKFDFDGVLVSETDPDDDCDVFLGSYAYPKDYPMIKPTLRELLAGECEMVDFEHYLSTHKGSMGQQQDATDG